MESAAYRFSSTVLILSLTLAIIPSVALAQEAGTFTDFSLLNIPRADFTSNLLPDGRVLVTGGVIDGAGDKTLTSELYDSVSGLFNFPLSPGIYPRSGHLSALLPDGTVLIVGGQDEPAEIFHADGTFSAIQAPIQAHYHGTATLLANGKVLIAGGSDLTRGGTTNFVELFDPILGVFTATGAMMVAREGHTATLLPDGKVLIAGGDNFAFGNEAGQTTTSAEVYDPASGTFSPTAPMTAGREFHTATMLNAGQVLLAGGFDFMLTGPRRFNFQSSAELFDPASQTFSATGAMADARFYHTATLLPDGRVLIAGGTNTWSPDNALAGAEIFDPASGTFASTGSMDIGRYLHQAVLLHSGLVLVMGGFDPNGNPLADTQLYHPRHGRWHR